MIAKEEQSKRKSVGILGGGFNPVHIGHLVMADQVKDQLHLDECYLMPTYEPPHVDHKTVIESDHRVEMLSLAIEGSKSLAIELAEIKRQGTSLTYDTMKALIESNPTTDYYFIIGGDMVEYLPKWHRIDELVKMVTFVGIKRSGYPEVSDYPVTWVDSPLIDVSSTFIREKIQRNDSVKYLLPDNVINYIKEYELYKGE